MKRILKLIVGDALKKILFFTTLITFILLTNPTNIFANENTYLFTGKLNISNYENVEYLENIDVSIVTVDPSNYRSSLASTQPFIEDEERYIFESNIIPKTTNKWHIENYFINEFFTYMPMKKTTIAVIDTGITLHKQLIPHLVMGKNVIEGNENVTDNNGHGTMVAGVIADIAGKLPVQIIPIKAADSKELKVSNIVKAIDYAIEQNVDIINLSFGASSIHPVEQQAIQAAIDAGILVISAAGNSGDNQVFYPASYDGVISVGAIDDQEKRAQFSTVNEYVDFVAPGVNIVTYNNNLLNPLTSVGGTSFASPYFAGILAALNTLYIEYDNEIDALLPFAKDLGVKGKDPEYGYGFIQPFNALKVLRGETREVLWTNNPNKKWTITFNKPFDYSSITEDTVYIINESLKKVSLIYSFSNDDKEIYVQPERELSSGEYWLIVSNDIFSQEGESLYQANYIKFVVE